MAEFESKKVTLNKDRQSVFEYLSDFHNFEGVMPPDIKNWRVDGDSCSFEVSSVGQITLRYSQKKLEKIIIVPELQMGKGVDLSLFITLEELGLQTKAQVGIETTINPMMRMMLSRPLNNLVNVIADKLAEKFQ